MIKIAVKTPTTAAAIHAPCQSGSVVSLTLETPLGNPIPEIFSVEQDVRSEIAPTEITVNTARTRDFLLGIKFIG
jgi:hypothetical protein